MRETPVTDLPLVLTSDGRRWLDARRQRATERLERVNADLEADRTEGLLDEQRQLIEQIDELTSALRGAVAPGDVTDDPSIVELGDEVEVAFPDGFTETFLVVHPLEAGMDEHRTSADSPLARAVLGHRVGDRVTVAAPAGIYSCTLTGRRRLG